MVIHQFNKLIRNKWIWGVFAIAVGGFFAFDFLIDDLLRDDGQPREGESFGKLAGETVDERQFVSLVEEIRGLGRQNDGSMESSEVNLQAWKNYAALKVAGLNGIEATDAEVMAEIRRTPAFQQNGAFSYPQYEGLLRQNSITPERYEASLKHQLTLMRLAQQVLGSAAWSSPMELDQAVSDMTDVFTVRVAHFTQEKKDADAVKLDDAGLRKWYDDNVKSLELPERIKIRYVKFNATETNLLARMTVTEDEMRDQYDATTEKYTSKDTNGVEVVKAFEEVKGEIEKDLRRIAAVECLETNLNFRAYAVKAANGASRLDEIAKEDGLKVETSDWFSLENGYQEGFMKSAYQILPGAVRMQDAVAELDPENEDLRYAVVSSERAVWLVERAAVSQKHTPTFEEAKEAIRPRALRAAKADAFKQAVEAIAAKGAEAVLATKDVSTNIVFTVADMKPGDFADQNAVARAAGKLAKKGDVSDFTLTGTGRALLVVCEERKEGDAGKAMVLRSQLQSSVAMRAMNQLPEAWRKWNLDRMTFETSPASSVEKTDDGE